MKHLKSLIYLSFIIFLVGLNSCEEPTKETVKPNILWIYLEDTSPILSSYGSTLVQTPHIDKLAQKGVLYTNAIMPAPVCSSVRSSIVTGMMATTLGLHNHHSSRTPEAAIYIPDSIKTIPEVFKNEGYFTFNNGKDDYNFSYDRKDLYSQSYLQHPLYGKKGINIPYEELKTKTPFFGQIQLAGGKEIFSSTFKEKVKSPVDRSKIKLPPYLPNHPDIIEEYANHIDAIKITDEKVGKIIQELEHNGLLKNTIVFFFSDHGMRLTRHKQFLYDGGLKVPLIIADFRTNDSGTQNHDLVSGLDLGTSSLALADIPIPHYMEGKNIFDTTTKQREYVISVRDRCDFTIDRIRSVRSKKYKYIRTYMTDRPYLQPTYMDVDGVPFVKTMKQLYADGKIDSIQSRFLSNERPKEELYDIISDPHEIHNLAGINEYNEIVNEYASVLENWIIETNDQGQYPENEENLKLMLGIWGDYAVNPEYDILREKYPELPGSQFVLKSHKFEKVE